MSLREFARDFFRAFELKTRGLFARAGAAVPGDWSIVSAGDEAFATRRDGRPVGRSLALARLNLDVGFFEVTKRLGFVSV